MTHRITASDLADLPMGRASGKYEPPPIAVLPPELHPAHAAVLAARDMWAAADDDRRRIEALAATADHDYSSAQRLAALASQDPAGVPDDRDAKRAAAAAARDRAAATRQAVAARWMELVVGICDHRERILAVIAPEMADAQRDALDALDAYTAARQRLSRAIGLHTWVAGLKGHGLIDGVDTAQGPKAEPAEVEVAWRDSKGRGHAVDARSLLSALETYARGHDALKAREAKAAAEDARRRGVKGAAARPIPDHRIVVA